MKFAKTFCAPGSTVSVVPVGLPVKLKYNEHGCLQDATIGFDESLDPQYSVEGSLEFNKPEFMKRVRERVPNTISTTGGTTWIYGVFYTDRIPCDEGKLPESLFDSYVKDIIKGSSYQFYAGYVRSFAADFRGPLVIRNYLGSSKFNILPQTLVSLNVTDETLVRMMAPSAYPFKYSYIAGFLIFEELNCRYSASNLSQINVMNDVKPFVDKDGYIKGEVKTALKETYKFSYSAILHHDVTKGSTLLIEKDDETGNVGILATRVGVGVEKVIDSSAQELKCPVCGKVITVEGNDLPIQCDDPHCLSHCYEDAVKMLTVLGLPSLKYDDYKKLVKDKKITCLPDILELEPYSDKSIQVPLSKAIYSIVPSESAPVFEIVERFANKLNGSSETLNYYLNNPLRIRTDLDITDPIVDKLIRWLQDPVNASDLIAVLGKVTIVEKKSKFEGAPIFRGNKIAITGKFRRGDYSEIESILKSYAATVVPDIGLGGDMPDVLIVGSLNDGVSGQMIQKARTQQIPIQDEDSFFTAYEIDKDLAANLL